MYQYRIREKTKATGSWKIVLMVSVVIFFRVVLFVFIFCIFFKESASLFHVHLYVKKSVFTKDYGTHNTHLDILKFCVSTRNNRVGRFFVYFLLFCVFYNNSFECSKCYTVNKIWKYICYHIFNLYFYMRNKINLYIQ